MNKVSILKIVLPEYISFWKFEKGHHCSFAALSGCIITNINCEKEKYSKHQIFGLLYHTLEESFARGEFTLSNYDSFLIVLDRFKVKYASNFEFSDYKSLDEWSEVIKLYDYFVEKRASRQTHQGIIYKEHYEKILVSKQYRISGVVDYIKEYEDQIELWEFKSGSLFDDNGLLKEAYIRQLHFYSILAEEYYNKPLKSLHLNSMIDGKKEIIHDRSLSELIIKQINSLRSKLCASIQVTIEQANLSLANPSLKICGHCDIRHLCKAFLEKQNDFESEEKIFAISGVILVKNEVIKPFNTLDVSTEDGTRKISNVPSALCISLSSEKVYAFLGLQKSTHGEFIFNKSTKVITYA